jgi:hypothetical protein
VLHVLELFEVVHGADAQAMISVTKSQLWMSLMMGAETFVGWRLVRSRWTIIASSRRFHWVS